MEGRSTSDIVWSHRWLMSKTYAENIDFSITGIDMPSAFDTINRHLLLSILKNIIREDEQRIIRYLLSNTELSIKLKGSSKTEFFKSNIETPQGDSLSPVIVNLEHALKNIQKIETLYNQNTLELAYADDVDFVSTTDFVDVETIQKELADSRQLRTILNIKYPTVIKNNALYQRTGETPIFLTILEARWQLFGHILRQAINTPPNVAMTKYFKTEGSKRRGRPCTKTSIVTTLRRDLKSHNSDYWPTRLYSVKDLDHLRDIAQNRSDWKHLTTATYRSPQAETSVDVAADGH
ncbi:very-long-chain enoyl-CoA reductase [Elysia marginata]|uniref:Very-long-chain enoyl-CoA reductase n=1 Tax=Elysia marginata TaxID=1093978 RepID=A0AAV4I3J5_9GAST|nr:very-long-chain enoyl-CoA reductase [Elysia marginata]